MTEATAAPEIKKAWVIARTRYKAMTLMHRLDINEPRYTLCGCDTFNWPWRRYRTQSGDSLFVCRRCNPHDMPAESPAPKEESE